MVLEKRNPEMNAKKAISQVHTIYHYELEKKKFSSRTAEDVRETWRWKLHLGVFVGTGDYQ